MPDFICNIDLFRLRKLFAASRHEKMTNSDGIDSAQRGAEVDRAHWDQQRSNVMTDGHVRNIGKQNACGHIATHLLKLLMVVDLVWK